ncbi:MAG: hypothetical protein QM296_09160 [Bacillota bacterium]|nr:hypothetical protein [Bacillota bacterium]
MTRRLTRYLLPVLLAALLAAGSACHAQSAGTAAEAPPLLEPVGVQLDTARVMRRTLADVMVCPATVRPATVTLSFAVAGRILKRSVSIGEQVTEGQEIAALDARQLDEELDNVARQRENLALDRDFELEATTLELEARRADLAALEDGSAPVPDGDVDRPTAVRLAEIVIRALERRLTELAELHAFDDSRLAAREDKLRADLEARRLMAPVSGRIIHITSQDGSDIGAYTPYVVIAREDQPQIESAYLSGGQLSRASSIRLHQPGRVMALSPLPTDWADLVSRSLSGRELVSSYELADRDLDVDKLSYGDYAWLEIVLERREDCLVIPLESLYREGGRDFVYVVEDGRRIRREVVVGLQTAIECEILEGLTEGEAVYVKT